MTFSVTTREDATSNSLNISSTRTLEGDVQVAAQHTIPASTTDMEIALAVDVSLATLVMIKSTQDLTIETNDGTTPDDTLSLDANIPMVWREGDYNALFLTVDVTSIFVTNAGASDATLQILVLTDLP